MKKRLGLVVSLLLCTATSVDATCTLGPTVPEEVSRFWARGGESVTHAKTDDGRIVHAEQLFREEHIAPGIYRVHNVNEDAGYLEVKTGLWVEARLGRYGLWAYDILVWNGGEMCSERNVQRGRVRFPGTGLQVARFPPLGACPVEAPSGSW